MNQPLRGRNKTGKRRCEKQSGLKMRKRKKECVQKDHYMISDVLIIINNNNNNNNNNETNKNKNNNKNKNRT
jgi:hypothetical protein